MSADGRLKQEHASDDLKKIDSGPVNTMVSVYFAEILNVCKDILSQKVLGKLDEGV